MSSAFPLGRCVNWGPVKDMTAIFAAVKRSSTLSQPKLFPVFHTAPLINKGTKTHTATWPFIRALVSFFIPTIVNTYRVLTMCLVKTVTSDIVILFNHQSSPKCIIFPFLQILNTRQLKQQIWSYTPSHPLISVILFWHPSLRQWLENVLTKRWNGQKEGETSGNK